MKNSFKKVEKIIGREGDNLIINDKEVSGSMLLNQVLKKNKGIIEMQIKQVKDDELFLSIVPSKEYDSSVGKRLKEQIRKRIGQSINIEITEVQEIPSSPSGKKKYILNQIK